MKPGIISDIIIDDGFKNLLPALDNHTRASLEESLLIHGCENPLFLWQGILIDGYNRFEIIKKHNLPFNVVSKAFDSREEVIVWIVTTQVGRRNLTAIQLNYFRGLHYNTEKIIVTNESGINQHSEDERQNVVQPPRQSTARRLAEIYNVNPRTIDRDAQLANAIDAIGTKSPDVKRRILSGEVEVTRTQLREMAAGAEDYIAELVTSIENDTFAGRNPRPAQTETSKPPIEPIPDALQPLEKMFGQITEDFSSALRNLTTNEDVDAVRSALRTYIERLEALYSNL
ncbi:MAG: hypothetical protein FWC66_06465 [Oscillospiraceae bacterium]|nr:hypothetical protein [Oscillospiraceae bacterium]